MNLIRCDECEKELSERYSEFFTLDRSGISTLRFDDHPGPWHFCSWECVSVYANGRWK